MVHGLPCALNKDIRAQILHPKTGVPRKKIIPIFFRHWKTNKILSNRRMLVIGKTWADKNDFVVNRIIVEKP